MKKLALTLLAFTLTTQTILASDFNLIINGEVSTTASPTQQNGTTLVPVRFVSEQLGGQVNWDAATETVTITRDGVDIELKVGSTNAKINGQSSTLTLAPTVQNGTTMIPLRFVSEALNVPVDWDADTSTVLINSDKADLAKLPPKTAQTQGFDAITMLDYKFPNSEKIFDTFKEHSISHNLVATGSRDYYNAYELSGDGFSALMYFDEATTPPIDPLAITYIQVNEGIVDGIVIGETTVQEVFEKYGYRGSLGLSEMDGTYDVIYSLIEFNDMYISMFVSGETDSPTTKVKKVSLKFTPYL
ncbi:MAG: hypothetical protein ATN35_09720 [Epulopiscium sp. Nele67-Bin004]|nr:MAG: hypothetical protein ATN35_09720 [Epulopiscium sp. Nele67-Bin004]